ncbi:MAG: metallophosphoesterase [Myxococcota bacterium]
MSLVKHLFPLLPAALTACPEPSDVADGDPAGGDDTGSPPVEVVPGEPVRFVAVGDAGTGDDNQIAVADGMRAVCETVGCDFVVYLGDNFYADGIGAADDAQWQEKFEVPYTGFDVPFWAVLGNHDYGGNGGAFEAWRTDFQVAYTEVSDKWNLPDQHYAQRIGDVTLFGLDSNAIVWGQGADQTPWFQEALAASTTTWRVAMGHHPLVSNGHHGNAGVYDGLVDNGVPFRDFMQGEVCGNVDLYLSGHDHNLQWLDGGCGTTQLIVSGTGGKTSSLGGANPTHFEAETLGFTWIELAGQTMTAVFYDADGVELYRKSVTKS